MDNEMNQTESITDTTSNTAMGRRGLFRIGAITVGGAAFLAACSKSQAGTLGVVGEGGSTPVLPDPIVNNGVLLRTMAGIELSIVNAYGRIVEEKMLSGSSATFPTLGDLTGLVTTFTKHHEKAAKAYNAAAKQQGADSWDCGNSRLDSAYLFPIFDRSLNGVAATDNTKAIDPSDDLVRDMINLVYTLEQLSAESAQALVPQVTVPEVRATAMEIGVRSARQASLMALKMNPGGYVTETDATDAQPGVTATTGATTTASDIPLPVALPSHFGALSPITYVGGRGDENGVRLKLNFESPSLNSLAYPFDECAKG